MNTESLNTESLNAEPLNTQSPNNQPLNAQPMNTESPSTVSPRAMPSNTVSSNTDHTSSSTLKVGILLPTREAAIRGNFSVAPLLDLAQRVEELGFDSLWAGDSLFARPRLDPLIVLAACAGVARRVTLGTAALTAALRHPLIGVNMLTSLEHAAPGRLRIGVGSGFPVPESEHEFGSVGIPFARRTARLDETVRLWKRVWACGSATDPAAIRDLADYQGTLWAADSLDRLPGPATPGGPGVWLAAGATPRVLSRVAKFYDGWLPFLPDPAEYRAAWDHIREFADEAGRPAGAIEPGLYATVHVDGDRARAEARLEEYVQGYYGRSLEFMSAIQAYGHGSPEQCAHWLAGFVEAGARQLVLRIGALDPGGQLDLIARELLPVLREATAKTTAAAALPTSSAPPASALEPAPAGSIHA